MAQQTLIPLKDLILIGREEPMTADELHSIITYMGLTQKEFGERLGMVDQSAGRTCVSISDYTRAVRAVPRAVARASRGLFMDHWFLPAYNTYAHGNEIF